MVDVDFHVWKSIFQLIEHSLARTTIQPPGANCLVCSEGVGHQSRLTHISFYDFWKGTSPPLKNLLSLYQELGPSKHFLLAVGARSPSVASDLHNFHVRSLNLTPNHSIVIYTLGKCRWTPHLAHSSKYEGRYACLYLCSAGSHSQAIVVQGVVMGHRPTQSAISPSSHLQLRCS